MERGDPRGSVPLFIPHWIFSCPPTAPNILPLRAQPRIRPKQSLALFPKAPPWPLFFLQSQTRLPKQKAHPAPNLSKREEKTVEEKRPKGLLSVLNVPNIYLFKLRGFGIPLFFLPAVPPNLFSPSPVIDTWGDGERSCHLSSLE